MRMTESFFELKYNTIDTFYLALMNDGYTVGQAVGFTYYSILGGYGIENVKDVIVAMELVGLQIRHLGKENYNDKDELKKIIDLNYKLDIENKLKNSELDYYLEEFGYISDLYRELCIKERSR